MYGVVLSVAACLRAGTRVDVAWIVGDHGFADTDPTDALALTPGGGRIGALLGGALDGQLVDLAGRQALAGRLLDLEVGFVDATIAGLPSGGRLRCILTPATALPVELWPLLTAREPVCVVSTIVDDVVTDTELYTADSIGEAGDDVAARFRTGVASATFIDGKAVTVLRPTTRLVVMGAGPIAEALAAAATLLGWKAVATTDPDTAAGLIAGLSAMDSLVVMGHEVEPVGRVLAAALTSLVGYIGALGSRAMQDTRAEWLAYRGFEDLDRINGPAGLAIGAKTPAEIAVAILAESLAVRNA